MANITTLLAVLFATIAGCTAIRCYQCSSSHDLKGEDNCGAYEPFDKERNAPVECNSGESHMPGSFCVTIIKQGPIGFVWDGRWRQVTRRCASVSSSGVTGVCNWGVDETNVYWEECYCSGDACNGASNFATAPVLVHAIIFFTYLLLSR